MMRHAAAPRPPEEHPSSQGLPPGSPASSAAPTQVSQNTVLCVVVVVHPVVPPVSSTVPVSPVCWGTGALWVGEAASEDPKNNITDTKALNPTSTPHVARPRLKGDAGRIT